MLGRTSIVTFINSAKKTLKSEDTIVESIKLFLDAGADITIPVEYRPLKVSVLGFAVEKDLPFRAIKLIYDAYPAAKNIERADGKLPYQYASDPKVRELLLVK